MSIKVSIIIPVYNVEEYIERCVNSVLNQTYRNLEIILVDDSSSDNSINIAKQTVSGADRSADLSFHFLKHDINRGQSAARNTGMRVATGDYVFFLDSDDEITVDCIEKLVRPLNDFRYDFTIAYFFETKKPKLNKELQSNPKIIGSFVKGEWGAMTCNKLCNLEYIKRNQLFFKEGILHEDALWSFQVAITATSMCFVGHPTYYYRIHSNSSSRSLSTICKRTESLQIVFQEMYGSQCKQKRYEYMVDCAIRQFFPLLEETMRQLPSFSLWDYYKKIRKADCRTMSQKRCVYNTVTRKLRYLDYFLPTSIGFMYRYFCWRLVRIKAGHANIPFIY